MFIVHTLTHTYTHTPKHNNSDTHTTDLRLCYSSLQHTRRMSNATQWTSEWESESERGSVWGREALAAATKGYETWPQGPGKLWPHKLWQLRNGNFPMSSCRFPNKALSALCVGFFCFFYIYVRDPWGLWLGLWQVGWHKTTLLRA